MAAAAILTRSAGERSKSPMWPYSARMGIEMASRMIAIFEAL
jgi:hypothetical protein